MALPPTALTDLLAPFGADTDALFRALRDAGCLTAGASRDPACVRAAVAEARERRARIGDLPGPTFADEFAVVLRRQDLLSARGLELADTSTL